MKALLLIPILFSASLIAGEIRKWTSADGTKHFEAGFVSREKGSVTLLRSDGKNLSLAVSMLHDDDQRWLNRNHPPGGGEPVPDDDAVFDTLKFGDSRDAVAQKLKASKLAHSDLDGTYLGRTGLNGVYRTKQKIGGLYCHLSFDWDENGLLKEITLQTENKTAAEYDAVLKPCWAELIELIGSIHGKPSVDSSFVEAAELGDGQLMASHLWKIESGGTVMLGTSRVGNGYQVAVRFTQEKLTDK